MNDDELQWLGKLDFIQSRIPKLDALSTFVPNGQESDPVVVEMYQRTGFSRWFPAEGGHRVLFPHERGSFDESRFSLETGAWDHETCKICRGQIPAMTLCWVTRSGPYIILCKNCHAELAHRDGAPN